MGNIIGDLNSRRGIVNELGTRNNLHVVNASVPLAVGKLREASLFEPGTIRNQVQAE